MKNYFIELINRQEAMFESEIVASDETILEKFNNIDDFYHYIDSLEKKDNMHR